MHKLLQTIDVYFKIKSICLIGSTVNGYISKREHPYLGPAVQSTISSTSSLRGQLVQCFTTEYTDTVTTKYTDTVIFVKKMRGAINIFC